MPTQKNKVKNPFKLSPREIEVLILRCEELSYKQIAGKLFIDTRTVQTHAKNIYEKMGIPAVQMLLLKKAIIAGYYNCPEIAFYYKNIYSE